MYVGECLLEKTLVLGHRLYEVGTPVPFITASALTVKLVAHTKKESKLRARLWILGPIKDS